ncbi:hypothetical protein COLO4_09814 [Corchorus olitorius]|uniref:Topoisomerase 6 subunit A/Spo11 TOPRIM domain-containing protein n=1 Tax=Corchorus olitorius TaxID=93759 RepID=A0A1R3KB09_9ROSI|nr:hypothetical protein COLO4_09814 [Corchorus olitorius]
MAYDAKFLRVPQIQWLGAFPSDSDYYGLPKQCLLPLTTEDSGQLKVSGKVNPCIILKVFEKYGKHGEDSDETISKIQKVDLRVQRVRE